MAHRPVGEHDPALVHAGGLGHQLGNSPVNVRFADDGNALFVEQAVGGAGHDMNFILEGVPALDGDGVAAVFFGQGFHGHLQFRHIPQVIVRNIAGHVFPAIGHHLVHFAFFFPPLLHFGVKLRQGDGSQLNIEFFQQLPFVAHGGPEIEGPGADLQNAGVAEYPNHVAHGQEVLHAPLKFGVGQIAVIHIGEGYLEAAQHLAGGEQAALGIAQAHAVGVGPLIPGTPKQHRHVQFLGQPRALVFRAEVGVGDEQAVHLFPLEFFGDFRHPRVVVEQSFLVDIVDVHEIHAHFPKPVGGQLPVFHGGRGGEDGPAGGGEAQLDVCAHEKTLLLYHASFMQYVRNRPGTGTGFRLPLAVFVPGKGKLALGAFGSPLQNDGGFGVHRHRDG